jgi:ATP-dependent helicase/nuclease subunit A
MAERKWTNEQLSAIESRGKTLLVSAAAGSGKTATLTERIIRRLLDKENPVTVDSLLIVTYTNAAASELRQKISVALEGAVRDNPDDEGLLRQLMMLPSAKIKTIDAFCNDVLRANVDRVGLPPSYRISTGAECEILSASILEGLIDAIYNGEALHIASPDEFEDLAECLTDSKHTEDLADVMKFVYDKCQSSIEGTEILTRLVDIYSPEKYVSAGETLHGKYLINKLDQALQHHIDSLNSYRRELSSASSLDAIYIPTVEGDANKLGAVLLADGYDEKREKILNLAFDKIKTSKNKTPLMEDFVIYRNLMKDDVIEYKESFLYSEDEWKKLYSSLYRILTTLCKFIFAFDKIFAEEKRQRGIVTYADLERYTYNCLWSGDARTDIAENLSDRFSEIYIDEYQDVNALQDKIFEAIAKPNNRFMVGDIKQSIYGFRSARPEIFARMKASYPPLAESSGDTASIFMSSNFRCDKGVVDFTNEIFDKMFTLLGNSIGYRDGDRLGYAKIHDTPPPYLRPSVVVSVPKKYSEEGDVSAEDAVAMKIQELIANGRLDNGERVKPSDIAIILRTTSPLDKYAEALSARGIATEISVPEDFFMTPEVLLTLAFLNTVDNPRRDIYLAGLLCSPIFGFDGNEIAVIRRYTDKETLYESLCHYVAENPGFAKGQIFLDRLNYYRSIAENTPVDKLIYKIYHETGLLSLASRNGGRKNLMFLYDHARSFESGAFKGLYNFISYIDNVISGKITAEFEERRAGEEENAVKIITAHSSKGLEYPIVFFVHANRQMSGMVGGADSKERWIKYSEEMGISLQLRTASGLARVKNPVCKAIAEFTKEKDFEEELRVLYVILTRAREQLYIVGESTTKDVDKYKNTIRVKRENLSPYSAKMLSSYLDVVLAASGTEGLEPADFLKIENKESEMTASTELEAEDCFFDGVEITPSRENLAEELTKRFNFTYSQPYMSQLPEKMSVSKITPTVLDGTEDDYVEIILPEEDSEPKDTLPAFMTGTDEAESAKRGIATHYFMQFCNLERFVGEGSEAELRRLVEEQYISSEDGSRVRIRELEEFRNSSLIRKMLGAKRLYRELRFNVRLPAKYFTEDEEKRAVYADKTVLVQGVIDCIIEDADGNLHLIDYKTDRLTREERANRHLGEERLKKAHTLQLSYYALAIREMFGKLPETIGVYSLHLGDEIRIDNCFAD